MNSNKSNIHLKGMWLCKAIPLVAILLIALYSAPNSRLSYAQTTFPPPYSYNYVKFHHIQS